jgi:hypothetical protein
MNLCVLERATAPHLRLDDKSLYRRPQGEMWIGAHASGGSGPGFTLCKLSLAAKTNQPRTRAMMTKPTFFPSPADSDLQLPMEYSFVG